MSRHRLLLPEVVSRILAEHRRAGVLRWRCVRCGQSWRCRSREWAEKIRHEIKMGRRPQVTSLPIGHRINASEVSDAMAVQTQGQAAHAATQVSGVPSTGRLLPDNRKAEGAHPV